MPFFDYRCLKCGKVNTLYRKNQRKEGFFLRWLKYRCNYCGSHRLERIYSSFSVFSKESTQDMLNELSRYGPINFVPNHRPQGPPPGGCPYLQKSEEGRPSE